jgi:hypothetical protein
MGMRHKAITLLLYFCLSWTACDSPSRRADHADESLHQNDVIQDWVVSLVYPNNDLSEVSGMRVKKLTISGARAHPYAPASSTNPLPLLRLDVLRTCYDTDHLHLESVQVASLKPLLDLPKLRTLIIAGCSVNNWDGLERLVHLRVLEIPGTSPPELSVIASLPNLTTLNIRHSGINDLDALRGHKKLRLLLCDRVSLTRHEIGSLKDSIPGIQVEDTYP